MAGQELCEGVYIYPDFVIALLLRFVKDKLQPPVQVRHLNVIHIFLGAVARMPHIANHISGRDDAAFLQILRIRIILPQMCVVIVALPVKAADADTPSAVLVPAQRFNLAGFYGNDRGTDWNNRWIILFYLFLCKFSIF